MAAKSDKVEPFAMLCFGQQDAGKSFNLEQFVRSHTNRMHIIFNPGHDKDWKGYEELRIRLDKTTKKLYFSMKGREYLFDRNFVKKVGRRGRVKILHEGDKAARTAFLRKIAFEKIITNLVLVVDDATSVFRFRLTETEVAIFSKTKHIGVKLILAYHDINYCPVEAFGLVTHIRQFVTISPLTDTKVKNKRVPMAGVINENWAKLQDLPKYSYFTIDIYKRTNTLTEFKGAA